MSHHAAVPGALALAVPLTLGAWTVQAADMVQTADQVGQFNAFVRMLEAADMVDVLESEGPFTVFAPTDEAFGRLPPGMLDRLLAEPNQESLQAVVQTHIVADAAIMAAHLLGQAVEVATLGGGTLAIDGTTGIIVLAPIEPSVTEVEAEPGAEQASIAMPVSMAAAQDPAPAPVTPGEEELMGVATVIAPDIEADNGVIHGIDFVLLTPDALWSF